MLTQSQALRHPRLKASPLKSLVRGSTLGLFLAAVMTGCQTTSNLPSSPSTGSATQSQTIKNTDETLPADSETFEEDYPLLEFENRDETAQQTVTDDDSQYSSPVTTPTPDVPEYQNQDSSVDTTSPSTPVPADTPTEIYVIKPRLPDPQTTQQILLEQARQNSKYSGRNSSSIQDGSNIPAFRKLMDTGVKQLRQGQISAAQSTFTRAQRMGPQSSAVYFYLGQVALKQNQPLKAEAMARRGLVVAKTNSRRRALWQVILRAAQDQGNTRVIREAKAALAQ